MHYNYLIVGGGIAGVTAAEAARGEDPNGSIAVIAREPYLLYSRVLLPSFIKGKVRREQLFLRGVGDFENNRIDLLLGSEAVFLDTEKREVRVKGGETYSFDKLLIASGGTPRVSGIPGETLPGVLRLQTIEDADTIRRRISKATKAAVIGGGFIGLEFLEITRTFGIPTVLVCRGKRFFHRLMDEAGGELMARNFERHGIRTVFGDEAERFESRNGVIVFRTKQGNVLEVDFVGLGVGLKRNSDFLIGTGIDAGPGQGVLTNEFLETNVRGIFAAGDIAEYFDVISGSHRAHGNWTSAFLQGRVAGRNMAGAQPVPFMGVPFYSITNLGLHITFLGEISGEEESSAVSRLDAAANRYERFFMRDNRIIGAVLINMFQDKPVITELIERKIPVKPEHLGEMGFDLKHLLKP